MSGLLFTVKLWGCGVSGSTVVSPGQKKAEGKRSKVGGNHRTRLRDENHSCLRQGSRLPKTLFGEQVGQAGRLRVEATPSGQKDEGERPMVK